MLEKRIDVLIALSWILLSNAFKSDLKSYEFTRKDPLAVIFVVNIDIV